MGEVVPIELKSLQLDTLQSEMCKHEQIECPVINLFTPGMYTRQIFMPADTVIISKVHKTTHTYNISSGSAAVYNQADSFLGVVEAPYLGVTIGGTRRLLHIISDCTWATNHPLPYITGEENDWDEERKAQLMIRIENDLIEPLTLLQ